MAGEFAGARNTERADLTLALDNKALTEEKTQMGSSIWTRRRTVVAALGTAALAVMILPVTAFALPAYATATGQACSVCHVNPAGGGALTAKGQAFAAISTHASNPAAAWAQVNAPAAAAPTAKPAAPAPAPATPAATPSTGAAPRTLPTTGDAGAASQLPMALTYLGVAFAGLGLSLRKRFHA